jgi:hypothetical protein
MKRSQSFTVVGLLALAGVVATSGCASGQMSRIDRHRDIYETWPLDIKQAVLDGKVEPGMNSDMVRVAWGEPSEVASSPAGDEIWVYKKGGSAGDVYYPGGPSYPAGGGAIGQSGIGVGGSGTGIGISTGRGGTSVGTSTGVGIGGGIGGVGVGGMGTGLGGVGSPIIVPPTPPEIREVVFRGGLVVRADAP